MKKFLCMTMLMLATLTVSAKGLQVKAYSPPEWDIGYKQVATLSVDGMTVYAFDSQFNIVDWQTPVMVAQEASTASAQVVDAITIATPTADVGMTLVAYRWTDCKPECTNHRCDYTYDVPTDADTYSFQSAHTDRL